MSDIQTIQSPLTVALEVVWGDSATKQDTRMSEISMAGCYIDASLPGMSVSDVVEFKVHLPNGPWVALRGQLTFDDYPRGCELSFLGLTDSDKRLLAHVVFPDYVDPQDANTHPSNLSEGTEPLRRIVPQRILIADDDPVTLKLLVAIVQAQGYDTVAVADGLAAMRVLQDHVALDAAIFDMTMPYAKGLDLINIMQANPKLKHIPIAMVSGEKDPKVWDDSIAAGASVFLPKPFTPDQIRMALRMLESKGRPAGNSNHAAPHPQPSGAREVAI
jgi:two-component system, chemotaxis family, chemotaxis protein CheY